MMKFFSKNLGFCLLIIFILCLIFSILMSTNSVNHNLQLQDGKVVEERIRRVENGLMPPFEIKGKTPIRMNLTKRMKDNRIPGISIAVINNGKIEWARGYGVKEAGEEDLITIDTLFQAASISKAVAATGALKLVEKGKLDLDEDINKKLVSWKIPANEFTKEKKVTLRNLLSHTAGLTVSGFPGHSAEKAFPTLPQILDGVEPANTKPVLVQETPGTSRSYSGGGFIVMQQLVMDVTKEQFPDFMRDTVINKIGMKNSTFEQPLPQKLSSQAAIAHNSKGEKITGNWHGYPEMAAAGLWTTPTDLASFAIELQQANAGKSRKFLSPEMVSQMLTKQTGGWGLGISITGEGSSKRFSHSGSNEGYRAMMIAYTETGQGAVVMSNSDNADPLISEIMRSIAAEYGWENFLAKKKTVVEVNPKILENYTGKYQLPNAGEFSVLTEEGKLKIQFGGDEKLELLPESETQFFLTEMGLEVTFAKDAEGRVTEMIHYIDGNEYKLKKLQ